MRNELETEDASSTLPSSEESSSEESAAAFCLREKIATFLLTFSICSVLFAVCRGPLFFWEEKGPTILPSGSYVSGFAAVLVLFSVILAGRKILYLPPSGIAASLSLLLYIFLSDWMMHDYNFFQAPAIRGELIVGALISLFFLRQRYFSFFTGFSLVASVYLFATFLNVSEGRPIFSDDHASVFYRLTLLKEQFPFIPFYTPFWNAGMDARDFFSTGILNFFFLGSPLIYLFPIENIYSFLVGAVLFLLLPGSLYLASRKLENPPRTAALSALIALATSLTWYRWGLKYGTMGFVTSATLVPLNLAFLCRFTDPDMPISRKEATCFVVLFSLMIFWSLTGVIFLPVVLSAAIALPKIWKKPYIKQIFFALILLNAPWIVLWLKVANVFHFVDRDVPGHSQQLEGGIEGGAFAGDSLSAVAGREKSPESSPPRSERMKVKGKSRQMSLTKALSAFRVFALNSNPLLLFLGLPGIFTIRKSRYRLIFGFTSLWLVFLGAVLAPVKPQLELDRMLIVLGLLLCLPVGQLLGLIYETLSSGGKRDSQFAFGVFITECLASVPFGFLLIGVGATASIIHNRSLERYVFTDRSVLRMADAIVQYGGEGRTLYTGFVLHELNMGHLAPLTYYTKRPLVASSPFHNRWLYTDIIPEYYRERGPAEIEHFLDLQNATSILAHEKFWRDYFDSQPNLYRKVWEGGQFVMYARFTYHSSYFAEGEGELVRQSLSEIEVLPKSSHVVIKFNYLPFLESTDCRLSRQEFPGGEQFIRLDDCPVNKPVIVRGRTGFMRLFASSF